MGAAKAWLSFHGDPAERILPDSLTDMAEKKEPYGRCVAVDAQKGIGKGVFFAREKPDFLNTPFLYRTPISRSCLCGDLYARYGPFSFFKYSTNSAAGIGLE